MAVEYIYDTNTINVFEEEDYGLVSSSEDSTDDFGSITAEPTTIVNGFYIWISNTVYPFGSVSVAGTAKEESTFNPLESNQLFDINGQSSNKFISAWVGSGSLFEIGGGLERIVAPWVGSSGPLRFSGTAQKNTTSYYSFTSINALAIADYEAIANVPNDTYDYGSITSPLSGGEEDYGNVSDNLTLVPFGSIFALGSSAYAEVQRYPQSTVLFTISGEARARQNPRWVGSGFLTFSGTRTQQIQRYAGSASSHSISGVASTKNTESYVGSGTAFRIGNLEESVTYDYNTSSVNLLATTDFGSITQFSSEVDYGLVSNELNAEFNYGNIEDTVDLYPFGNISLSGTHILSFTADTPDDFALYSITGSAEESFSTQGGESTQLYNLIGSSINSRTKDFVGSGVAFRIGTAIEARTYDYNNTSINYFTDTDFGVITQFTNELDYGFILSELTSEFNNGNIEDLSTLYPFGSVNISGIIEESFGKGVYAASGTATISGVARVRRNPIEIGSGTIFVTGSAVPKNTESYVGTGVLSALLGSAESFTSNPIESTSLYSIVGAATERNTEAYVGAGNLFSTISSTEYTVFNPLEDNVLYNISGSATIKNTESYVGSGVAFHIGLAEEARTYDYNISSTNLLNETDFGSITQFSSELDYGNVLFEEDAQFNYGVITNTTSLYPYGSITVSGVIEESFGKGVYAASGTATISGVARVRINPIWYGSGSINLTSSASERNTESYVGTGSTSFASGSAEVFGANPPESTSLFSISGSAIEKHSEDFVADSSLPTLTTSTLFDGQPSSRIINTKTFDDVSFSPGGSGLGSLGGFNVGPHLKFGYPSRAKGSTARSVELVPLNTTDVSSISFRIVRGTGLNGGETPDSGEDLRLYYSTNKGLSYTYYTIIRSYNGTIGPSNTSVSVPFLARTPYTIFKLQQDSTNGSSFDHYGITTISVNYFKRPFSFISNIGVFADVKFVANPPENISLYDINGSAKIKNTESYVGSGVAFNIGTIEESVTYDYNTSSINTLNELDFGSVSTLTSEIDYGFVSGAEDAQFNYGNIEDATTLNPFGSIYLSGSLSESFGKGLYTASGTATISGVARVRINPIWYGSGTISLSGSAEESHTESYVGTGSTSFASGSAEVFGANPPESTTLYTFTGSSVEKNTESYIGTGLLSSTGSCVEYVIFNPSEDTSLFNISGSSVIRNTESYVGSGVAFHIGLAEEARTYDYNQSSTNLLSTTDFGSITQFSSELDYGNVLFEEDAQFNYGVITDLIDLYPFGSINISGVIEESFSKGLYTGSGNATFSGAARVRINPLWFGSGSVYISGTSIEKNTESYVGTGSTAFASGSAEVFGANPPESIVLYTFTGSSVEKNTESYVGTGNLFTTISSTEYSVFNPPEDIALYAIAGSAIVRNTESYVGSGSAFNLGTIEESVTYDYNTSSINLLSTIDFGFVTQFSTSQDYGLVSDELSSEFNYGVITNTTNLYPFGSLFSIGGISESFVAQPTEDTVAYIFSGNATVKYTPRYFGSGSLTINVAHLESNTESYIGAGSLSIVNGSAEVFVSNPPENIVLFDVTGNATEKHTEVYTGSGSAFTAVSSSEYVIFNPSESIVLYQIGGNSSVRNIISFSGQGFIFEIGGGIESRTYHYNESSINLLSEINYGSVSELHSSEFDIGLVSNPLTAEVTYGDIGDTVSLYPFGSIKISGFTSESLAINVFASTLGNVFISGSAESKFTPKWIGSGSLSTVGAGSYKHTNYADGSGSINIDGTSIIKTSVSESVLGEITIDISSSERNTESYVGTGSVSIASGSAEVFGANPLESTQIFTVSGSGSEKLISNPPEDFALLEISVSHTSRISKSWFGSGGIQIDITSTEKSSTSLTTSGSLFTFTGASEAFGANPVESIVLFNLSGSASIRNIESYTGTGSLSIASGSAEVFGANPPENIVLYTFTGFATEKNTESYNSSGTYTVSGESKIKFVPNWIGSGTLFTSSGAAESFGANPIESISLYNFSGFASEKNTESHVGTGTEYLTGTISEKTVAANVGSGSLFTFTGASEAFGANPVESIVLFNLSGSASIRNIESYTGVGSVFSSGTKIERVTHNTPESIVTFSVLGSAIHTHTESYGGSGSTTISGISENIFARSYTGSGSVFNVGGSSESIGVNPQESTVLYTVSGISTTRYISVYKFAGSTEVYLYGNSESSYESGAYQGKGKILLLGSANISESSSFEGNGFVYVSSTAKESLLVNPPESTVVYNVEGYITEKHIESYAGNTQLLTSGQSYITPSFAYSGNGLLNNLSGAAEAFGANPQESTILYAVGGNATITFTASLSGSGTTSISIDHIEKHTESYDGNGSSTITGISSVFFIPKYVGSGSLFTFTGASEAFGSNPPESTVLYHFHSQSSSNLTRVYAGFIDYNISINSEEKHVESYTGLTSIDINGQSLIESTLSYVGSGSLFTIDGSSESFTADPEEQTTLFTISGTSAESYSIVEIGNGNATLFGQSQEKITSTYVGFGTKIISGFSENAASSSYTGGGSLFAFTGASEAFGANPPESTILYEFNGQSQNSIGKKYTGEINSAISGSAIESHTESYEGNIGAEIYGNAINKSGKSFVSSGSLFGFGGSSESAAYNPEEQTTLFVLNGYSSEISTRSYVGVGNISATNTAKEKHTESYVGTGSLYQIGGSSEYAVVNPQESTVIYTFSGTLSEKHTEVFVGSGSIFNIGGASVTDTNAFVSTGLFKFAGSATERNTEAYVSSGSSTLSGFASIARIRSPYNGSGTIFLDGNVTEEYREFVIPRSFVLVI